MHKLRAGFPQVTVQQHAERSALLVIGHRSKIALPIIGPAAIMIHHAQRAGIGVVVCISIAGNRAAAVDIA